MLIDIIDMNPSYIDKKINKVNCFKTAATKFNHETGELMDINLKDRFVLIDSVNMQRDSHSALNLKYVKKLKILINMILKL